VICLLRRPCICLHFRASARRGRSRSWVRFAPARGGCDGLAQLAWVRSEIWHRLGHGGGGWRRGWQMVDGGWKGGGSGGFVLRRRARYVRGVWDIRGHFGTFFRLRGGSGFVSRRRASGDVARCGGRADGLWCGGLSFEDPMISSPFSCAGILSGIGWKCEGNRFEFRGRVVVGRGWVLGREYWFLICRSPRRVFTPG
jgi:hypothetical protein